MSELEYKEIEVTADTRLDPDKEYQVSPPYDLYNGKYKSGEWYDIKVPSYANTGRTFDIYKGGSMQACCRLWGCAHLVAGDKWSLREVIRESNMLENFTQLEDDHVVETYGGIESTLQERGNRYGDFEGHAKITQALKRAMVDSPKWLTLSDDKKEALEMVAHKIGRILNGDPEYKDSWHDIIGYTKLVEETLVDGE